MGFDAEDDQDDLKAEKPFCRLHFCAMERYKTKPSGQRYFRCKVKGCKETQSQSPPSIKLPTAPTICPICGSAMEVTKISSFFVSMVCPGKLGGGLDCGHKHEFPRPDINQKIKKIARKIDSLDLF